MDKKMQDTPFYVEAARSLDHHMMEYAIHRVGEGRICVLESHAYARRIVDALNREYRERVATALLRAVTTDD